MIASRLRVALLSLGLAACGSATAPPDAIVRFQMDAPFCGGLIVPIQFSIDGRVVGTDTMTQGKVSRSYTTTAGERRLVAEFPGHLFMSDTVVTLQAGAVFTRTFNFYCS